MLSSCRVWTTVTLFSPYHQDILLISVYEVEKRTTGFLLTTASIVSVNVFPNTFPPLCDNFRLYLKEARTNQECKHRLNIDRAVIGRYACYRSIEASCSVGAVDVPNRQLFFGDKVIHLESDFRKLGSVAVLRSLIRILHASLAQIDTKMAEKYAKL